MEDIFFREGTSAVLFRCCRRAFSTIEDGIPISDLYITLTYMENSFDLCWKKLWLKFASEEKYKLWGIPLILTLHQIIYSFFLHLFFEICSCQFSTVLWERKSEENYVGLKIKIELSTKYGRAIYESYKSALTNIILFFKDLLKKTFHVIVPKKTSTNQLTPKDSVPMSSVYSRFLSQNCGFVRVKGLLKKGQV